MQFLATLVQLAEKPLLLTTKRDMFSMSSTRNERPFAGNGNPVVFTLPNRFIILKTSPLEPRRNNGTIKQLSASFVLVNANTKRTRRPSTKPISCSC